MGTRRVLRRLLAAVAVAVACTVLAEGVLRTAVPLPGSQRLRLRQELPGLAPEIVYERNAFGLRSLSMETREKPPGALRVLCLGASTTDQPTQSTGDTWCGLLERRLEGELASRGVRLETASYGRGGMRAPDLLRWAETELLAYEPDLVVTLLGVNDLAWPGGPDYAYDGRLERALPAVAAPAPGLRCRDVSQLCRRGHLLRERLSRWRALGSGREVEWHSRNLPELRREHRERPAVEAPAREPDPLREFSDAVEALLAFLGERGVATVVLGQPVLWKPTLSRAEAAALWFPVNTPGGYVRSGGAWLAAEMERYNRVQRDHAARHGAAYLDLDARIPKDLDHYFDDCHFTDRGSRLVAEQVLPLVRAGLRERGGSP